jgi:CubicO group peptidase (beta-lactamase class C family)
MSPRCCAQSVVLFLATLPLLADPFDPVREFIRKGLVETGMPSISVAVAKNGEIVWEEGFGWADREKRIRASGHTMYSLASISKPITATGLMVLAQQGKLDLDRSVNGYLGNASVRARVGDAAQATVRRVANHSSGLPLHVQFFYHDTARRPPSMDETILRYGNLVTAPGERFQYSNLGFGILDYVIERVSRKTYTDFMREEVFIPLGLTRTSVHIGPGLDPFVATRYGREGLPVPFYDFDHPGASAVWSSAHDLAQFGMFHLKAHLPDQKPILSDESIDAMQKPTFTSDKNIG